MMELIRLATCTRANFKLGGNKHFHLNRSVTGSYIILFSKIEIKRLDINTMSFAVEHDTNHCKMQYFFILHNDYLASFHSLSLPRQ
jgi:hypothetical protein